MQGLLDPLCGHAKHGVCIKQILVLFILIDCIGLTCTQCTFPLFPVDEDPSLFSTCSHVQYPVDTGTDSLWSAEDYSPVGAQ